MNTNDIKGTKAYLVEDHPLVRSYLTIVLEKELAIQVIGAADATSVARQEIETLRPRLVILDLTLRGGHGLELLKDLGGMDRPPKVLVLSAHEEAFYAERAIQAGASGYLGKSASPEELVAAVRRVLEGEIYLSASMTERVLRKTFGRPAGTSESPFSSLSDRELEVFELLGHGSDTRQIAEHLGIDAKTVDTYRFRIKEKLGIDSVNTLLMTAFQWVNGITPTHPIKPKPAS